MPTYKRGLKIGTGWNRREAALGGVSTKGLFTDKDKGKPLKLVSDSTYDICADGDEIEEVLVALAGQQPTVNGGYQIGTICDDGQFLGVVGSATVAVGDFLVAGAQAAHRPPQTDHRPCQGQEGRHPGCPDFPLARGVHPLRQRRGWLCSSGRACGLIGPSLTPLLNPFGERTDGNED